MRKFLWNIVVAVALLSALPSLCVRAAGGDGFRIDESGNVTIVSGHAAEDGIASLSFGLSVESEGAVRVEFRFAESSARITEFRYDQSARRLNIYMAGTEALFAEGTDSLTVGRIVVLNQNGAETAARVSVVADSLQYVYGTELKTMENLELPGTVQIGSAGAEQPTEPPAVRPTEQPAVQPTAQPSDEDKNNGNDGDDNNDNDDDDDDEEEDVPAPAVTPAPTAAPKPTAKPGGVVVLTPSPVRPTARPASTPPPTATPAPSDSSQGAGNEPRPTASAGPGNTPDAAGGLPSSGGNPSEGEDADAQSQGGLDPVIWVAVAAVVMFVVVAAMAVAVLRKLPKRPKY